MNQPAIEPRTRRVSCSGHAPAVPALTGRILRAVDGAMLGRISGFIVEDGTEDVLFAVVCFASLPRLGEDARVVPWSLVDDCGDACIVRLPASFIRAAPIFVASTCCADPSFWNRVDDHFRRHAA